MQSTVNTIFFRHKVKTLLIISWLTLVFSLTDSVQIIIEYGAFIFLGVLGAIFANSTGAGGGVIFVPFFNQLSLSNEAVVATSFAIQCCGMTAGAISWYKYYSFNRTKPDGATWSHLPSSLFFTVPFSLVGLWVAQYGLHDYQSNMHDSLHLGFGIFSILLAIAIYASIPLMKAVPVRFIVTNLDKCFLALISFIGGGVTAWLSVGVGELIAVYLILRGANIASSIAVAVILSAFTVWAGITFHIVISQAIYWHILLFSGAGAIIGGLLAKHLVLKVSVIKLKIFFASWVMIMGVAGLPIY